MTSSRISHAWLLVDGDPEALVERSVRGSLCFGVYRGTQQIGFARVITDRATFAYVTAVFILETSGAGAFAHG